MHACQAILQIVMNIIHICYHPSENKKTELDIKHEQMLDVQSTVTCMQ